MLLFPHAAEKQSLLKEKPMSPSCPPWLAYIMQKERPPFQLKGKHPVHSVTAKCSEWKQNYTLHSCCEYWSFPIVAPCNFSGKKKKFPSVILGRLTVIMPLRTIKYCEHRLPRCAPDQIWTKGGPPPSTRLNNFSALLRWHLLAYFLSYPFISCHFSEASQVAAAKRNGRWQE